MANPSDRELFPGARAAIAEGIAEAVADLASTERRPLVIMFRPCSRCGEAIGCFPEQPEASVICSRCLGRMRQSAPQ
jgi:hypothetical protein